MKVQVDKVVGCINEDKSAQESYKNSFILINSPSPEKSLCFTDAKVNNSFFRDIGFSGKCKVSLDSPKIINSFVYQDTNFPSIKLSELQNFYDSVVFKLNTGDIVRLLKVQVVTGVIKLPSAVSKKLASQVITKKLCWSNWD